MSKPLKRRHVVTAGLVLLAIVLQFQSIWLPLLPQQIALVQAAANLIEHHSGLLQGLAVLAGATDVVVTTARKWLSPENTLADAEPLLRVSESDLRRLLRYWGGRVAWVNREVVSVDDLAHDERIVLTGPENVGKTREAIELIASAVLSDRITWDCVFIPGVAVGHLGAKRIQANLPRALGRCESVLLFIDDLAAFDSSEMLEELEALVKFVQGSCPVAYVITTIRTEHLTRAHSAWLADLGFVEHAVPLFSRAELSTYLENAIQTFGASHDTEAEPALLNRSDGTPDLVLRSLVEHRRDNAARLTASSATAYASRTLANVWADNRQAIRRTDSFAWQIVETMAIFDATGMKPFFRLVCAIAFLDRYGGIKRLELPVMKRRVRRAMAVLAAYDVVASRQSIVAPSYAVRPVDPLSAQLTMGRWLSSLDRLSGRLLLFFFGAAAEYEGSVVAFARVARRNPRLDRALAKRLRARADAAVARIAAELVSDLDAAVRAGNLFGPQRLHELVVVGPSGLTGQAVVRLNMATSDLASGFESLREGALGDAWIQLGQAAIETPKQPWAHYGLALVYYRWGQMSEALKECERSIELDAKFVPGLMLLGNMQANAGELLLAAQDYRCAAAADPTAVGPLVGLARLALLEGRSAEALGMLQEAHRKAPDDRIIEMRLRWLELMTRRQSSGRFAERTYDLLLAYLTETTANVTYASKEDLQVALSEAKWIIEYLIGDHVSDVDLMDVLLLVGSTNLIEGRFREAVGVLKRATEYRPRSLDARILLGKAYLGTNELGRALEEFEQAATAKSRTPAAWIGLANTYLRLGRLDEAMKNAYKALDKDCFSAEGHIMAASIHRRLGNEPQVAKELAILSGLDNLRPLELLGLSVLAGDGHAAALMRDGLDGGDILPTSVRMEPWYFDISADSGFRQLLEQHRLLPTRSTFVIAGAFGQMPGETQGVLEGLEGVATVLMAQGYYRQSKRTWVYLLDRYRSVFGEGHPRTLSAFQGLGDCLFEAGAYSEALGTHSKALEGRRTALGPDHPDTLESRRSIAYDLEGLGDPDQAAQMLQHVLDDCRRALGEDDFATTTTIHGLVKVLFRSHQHHVAVELAEQLLARRKALYGDDHPLTLNAREVVALARRGLGQPDVSCHIEQDVLELRKRIDGLDAIETLDTLHELGVSYRACGRLDESTAALQEEIATREQVQGPEHPETLQAKYELAVTLKQSGDPSRAVDLLDEVVAGRVKRLGPDHPETAKAAAELQAWT